MNLSFRTTSESPYPTREPASAQIQRVTIASFVVTICMQTHAFIPFKVYLVWCNVCRPSKQWMFVSSEGALRNCGFACPATPPVHVYVSLSSRQKKPRVREGPPSGMPGMVKCCFTWRVYFCFPSETRRKVLSFIFWHSSTLDFSISHLISTQTK